jgi:hypothetical protein
MRIKVVKKIISGTHSAELFVHCLESHMERHEGCSLKMQESGKKRSESGETIGGSYATGRKIKFDLKYQIAKDR